MSEVSAELLQRLIVLCKQVAAAPERWTDLVAAIHEGFLTTGAVLFTPEATGKDAFGIAHGAVAHGVEDYFVRWSAQDAWNTAVADRPVFRTASEVRFGEEFLANAALRRTAFYDGWARRFEAERVLSLKVEDATASALPVMHLTLFRRFSDAPFRELDARFIQALWPHLRLAAQAWWTLRHVTLETAQTSLEVLSVPTWVLRADSRIEFANSRARDLMSSHFGAVRIRHGALRAFGDLESNQLASLLKNATLNKSMHAEAVSLPGASLSIKAIMRIVPVTGTPIYTTAWPAACALVMLETAAPDSDALWMDHLTTHHQFAPAQRKVLEYLRDGLTVEEIAQARGVRVGTVRTQVHALLERTGLEKQSDLVRLALGRRRNSQRE